MTVKVCYDFTPEERETFLKAYQLLGNMYSVLEDSGFDNSDFSANVGNAFDNLSDILTDYMHEDISKFC